jgi:PAS domain S-box-containing protein
MTTVAQRLRTRLAIIGLVAMLPAIGATLYIQSTERQAAAERAMAENRRLLHLAADQQAAVFEGARQLLHMLSEYPAMQSSDAGHCSEVLRNTLASHEGYYNLAVVTPTGTLACAAKPVEPNEQVVARRLEWFAEAVRDRNTIVGGYQISPTVGKPTILMAQPIFDASGHVVRIVAAAIAVSRLNHLAADAELPPGGTLTMFDRTGRIVARYPDGDRWIGMAVPDQALRVARADVVARATSEGVGVDGVHRLFVSAPVRASIDTGLYLSLGIEPKTAFAAANRTFGRYMWLLAFVSLAAVAASLAAGHLFVVKPVIDLSDASHRTARELLDAEGRYQQLFENNPNPMWAYDRISLNFLEVNEAAVHVYGYSRDEFLQMRVTDIRPPDDLPPLEENLSLNREPWALDGRRRHRLKSGEIIDVETTSHLFTFEGRDAELITAQNVTDRIRAQEALADRTAITALTADIGVALNLSQDLRRCLLRCAQAIIAHLEPHAVQLRTIGQTGDLAIDLTLGDRLDADEDFRYMLAVGAKVVGVMTISTSPRFSDATTTGLAAVADVVALGIERHLADHARRDAETSMRFALDATGVGIWEADIRTGAAYWSDTALRMHGMTPEAFAGTLDAFRACTHPDDRDAVWRAFAQQLRERRDIDMEYRTLWPNGTVRRIQASGRVEYDDAGTAMRVTGVVMDRTDRRSLEDQLRQAQKMEAIGQLAGGVAHDFNNLLTAIQGFAGLVAETFSEQDDRLREITEIQRAADRAASLTRQLLAFSRKQMFAVRVLSVGEVVAGLAPMLRRLLGETIELTTQVSDDAHVKADPGQLEQVMLNLAVNGRDAMARGGGKLTITTTDVVLDEAFARHHPSVVPGPHVRLSVTDTGCGMDAETQKRIFEPFFTTKPKDRGTGLGLATVYGIVKQSGGSIWVQSRVGEGATFDVYLPCTDEPMPAAERREEPRPASGAEFILVVEDEPLIREYVGTVLTRRGYRVHVVGDPEEALAFASTAGAIDMVFTDVVLPGISGPAMVTELMKQHPTVSVLYMSGYVDHSILPGGLIRPDMAFLQKPFTADALANKVRDVLDSQRTPVA